MWRGNPRRRGGFARDLGCKIFEFSLLCRRPNLTRTWQCGFSHWGTHMRKSTLALRIRCGCAFVLFAGTILLLCLAPPGRAADAARKPTEANGFRIVDLSSYAKSAEGSARQFSMLPTGFQKFHGVPFRVGSRVAVTGIESARAGEFFPTEVTGVKIGGIAKRIHLLHGTMFADKDGVPVAKLVFHYGDGTEEAVRL